MTIVTAATEFNIFDVATGALDSADPTTKSSAIADAMQNGAYVIHEYTGKRFTYSPMTDKQATFIGALARNVDWEKTIQDIARTTLNESTIQDIAIDTVLAIIGTTTEKFGPTQAIIDALINMPKVINSPSDNSPTVTDPGVYAANGNWYLVTRSARTNRLSAKVRTAAGKWEYARGAIYQLAPTDRVEESVITDHGRLTNHCLICNRELTVKESRERGIGPICAEKVGL